MYLVRCPHRVWGKLQHHHSGAPHALTQAVVVVAAVAVVAGVVTDTVAGGLA